jgi:hypothetical protein
VTGQGIDQRTSATMNRRARGATTLVVNTLVTLSSGRQYKQGAALAVAHPDADELLALGAVRPA